MPPSKATAADSTNAWTAQEAEQKKFRILAGVGVGVVLLLGYFALTLGPEEPPAPAAAAVAAPADSTADSTAVVAVAPGPAAPPPPPGMGGGAAGGGGGGGGGRPTSGAAPTRPAGAAREQVRDAAREKYTSQGLRPRAAAALADSAAGRPGQTAGASAASGRATAARATNLLSGPGGGPVAANVPAGAPITLSGCEPIGGSTWCRASFNGASGWVRQADVSG